MTYTARKTNPVAIRNLIEFLRDNDGETTKSKIMNAETLSAFSSDEINDAMDDLFAAGYIVTGVAFGTEIIASTIF